MASELQALLRFLTQDAKVPLATAIAKVRELQNANLNESVSPIWLCHGSDDRYSPSTIAKSDVDTLKAIFSDEKLAKQVLNAGKRITKKRASGDNDVQQSPRKALKSAHGATPTTPAEIEASVALPASDLTEEDLAKIVVFTNRAPLVLAFVVTLLQYTMPNQPLSSRLSLAQAYVSITSRSRAIYLGIESGRSAEEEGFGEGQPVVKIMGKDLRVMKRWGYDWKEQDPSSQKAPEDGSDEQTADREDDEPAVWGVDLEALKKSSGPASSMRGMDSSLPIYTPQSARAYLLKSFDSPKEDDSTAAPKKKATAAAVKEAKEANLGHLLKALNLLYQSWATVLDPAELDRRTWDWYVAVRPAVADGVAGWGGKNNLEIGKILHLRRKKS